MNFLIQLRTNPHKQTLDFVARNSPSDKLGLDLLSPSVAGQAKEVSFVSGINTLTEKTLDFLAPISEHLLQIVHRNNYSKLFE